MYMSADAQACGSFETYMRRYALRSAFGLCGEDDDGQVATNMARSKAARATAPGQQKAPATAPHSGPDRQKMLVKCAKLGAEFIELGGTAGSTEKYMAASFGTEDMQDLTDEQIIQLGQHLNETVGQLKEQKGNQQ